MMVKIGRGHKVGDTIQIGNGLYKINQFYEDCREECDLSIFDNKTCRSVACNAYDRLDNRSVVYKLKRTINTPYDNLLDNGY